MSFDIKRVVRVPYQRLERPGARGGQLADFKKAAAGLIRPVLYWLPLLIFLSAPLLFFDFGILVFIVLAALLSGLYAVKVVWLEERIKGYDSLLNYVIIFLLASFLLSASFGAEPLASLGLSWFDGRLSFPVLFFALALFLIIYQNNEPARYWRLLPAAFSAGVALLSVYILARAAGGGWAALNSLDGSSLPLVLALNIFWLVAYASGAAGRLGVAAAASGAVPALAVLFLWDKILPLALVILGLSCLLIWQILHERRLWQRRFVWPAAVWIVAVVMLIMPVYFIVKTNAPTEDWYHLEEVWSRWQEFSWSRWFLGYGAGNAALALLPSASSFYSPALEAASPAWPAERRLVSGAFVWLLEGGLFGLGAWLVFLALIILKNLDWLRRFGPSLRAAAGDEDLYHSAVLTLTAILAGLATLAGPWSAIMFVSLLLWTTAGFGSQRQRLGAKADNFDLARSERRRWSARLAGFILLALVVGFTVIGARRTLAGAAAGRAAVSPGAEAALALWSKAARLDPRASYYQVKRAAARFQILTEETALPEQREIIEDINTTLAQAIAAPANPVIPWTAARLYTQLERYAEGSANLARFSYLQAADLWPGNVALITELAEFYREFGERLQSGGVTVSDLQIEARDRLKRALKFAPEYLPARLELAFIVEKQNGIPAAVAELEPWEAQSPEIMYHVGRLYFNDNKLEVARDKFLLVLEQIPNHSNAHYSLGIVYFRQGLYKEALAELGKVDELNPGNADVAEKIEEVKKKVK